MPCFFLMYMKAKILFLLISVSLSTVRAVDSQFTALELGISYIAQDRIVLISEFMGASVTWSCSPPLIATSGANIGAVSRPEVGSGDASVSLTATITPPSGNAFTKTFDAIVAEKDYANMLTYVTGVSFRTAAASLAVRADGEANYTVLNNGKPVVYPNRLLSEGTDIMRTPSLFRHPDKSFGLIAGNNDSSEFAYFYDTKDLRSYTNERLVRLNAQGLNVHNAFAAYDNAIAAYRVYWQTDASPQWYETITDLEQIIEVNANVIPPVRVSTGSLPQGAQQANAIRLTKAEHDIIRLRMTRLHNTGITPFEDIYVKEGSLVTLPPQAILEYNDGTAKHMNVDWNTDDVARISRPGRYTVNGVINQQTYIEPFIRYRADPMVFKDPDSDYYYFTGSYPTWAGSNNDSYTGVGYDRIILRRSTTVQGLGGTVKIEGEPAGGSTPAGPYNPNNIEEITIWRQATAGNAFNRYIWAPEIQKINGVWYILFTSSNATNSVWSIRPAFLVNRGDPFNPADWNEIYRLEPLPDDPHNFEIFSLDMTYFKANGKDYVTWTHKPGNNSTLVLAEVEPNAPWKLKSNVILLHQPSFAWEWENTPRQEHRGGHRINEAQAVIKKDGIIYMAYSGSTVDHNYSIGMITAKETDALLNPDSWTIQRFPSLSTADLNNQSGPGHNSFTIDANGNPIIVYHARIPGEHDGTGNGGLDDPGRHAFVKPVQYNIFGDIILYMTPEEELNPKFKNVSITIVVN